MSQDPDATRDQKITGVFSGRGVICPQFRLDSGETISLSNIWYDDLVPGEEVTFAGIWSENSKCMQGREFRVLHRL